MNVNLRYSYRSAQPNPLSRDGTRVADAVRTGTSDRINADGSIVTQRNLGRKDNVYSSLDLRLSREFALGRPVTLEPIFEVFNVFNSENFLAPGDDEPGLQLRRHGPRRPGRPAPGAARACG